MLTTITASARPDPAARRSAGTGPGHHRWAGRARPEAGGGGDRRCRRRRSRRRVGGHAGEAVLSVRVVRLGRGRRVYPSGDDERQPGNAHWPGFEASQRPGKIAIQYVLLYRYDCGELGGLPSHYGDVEPFAITLAPNAACPHGWGAWALKTVAHEGAPGQHTDQRFLGNDCYLGPAGGRIASGGARIFPRRTSTAPTPRWSHATAPSPDSSTAPRASRSHTP